jgi:hypothetical protein
MGKAVEDIAAAGHREAVDKGPGGKVGAGIEVENKGAAGREVDNPEEGKPVAEGRPAAGAWGPRTRLPHRMDIRNKKGRLLFRTSGKSR